MPYSHDIAGFVGDIREAAAKAGAVIELGPGKGDGSTLAIQEGCVHHPDPLHISVDHQDYMEQKPTAGWWHLVIGDSRDLGTVRKVSALLGDRSPGLIFIDTHHTYPQMKAELEAWAFLAGPETVWLMHDTWMMGEYNPMTDAIKDFAERSGWSFDDFRTEPHGLGRLRWTG